MKSIEDLTKDLDNCTNMTQLSKSFDEINKALDKSCNNLFNQIFHYKFSRYLYYKYIILNRTKKEIGEELGLSPSTIYYYINKYKISKSKEMHFQRVQETLKLTMQEKYGVNHPGELPEVHMKRINNILEKSNGQYNKTFYKKLKKPKKVRNKISKSCKQHWKLQRQARGEKK